MIRLPRLSTPSLRSLIAVALVFAQAVASFGFPVIQTRHTVKACGCVTPCGADSANCCCTKPKPEPKKPRCPKCIERDETPPPPVEPSMKWIAAFQSKQCRGESVASVMAEFPSAPPADVETGRDHFRILHTLPALDSALVSHISAIQDPPPRRS